MVKLDPRRLRVFVAHEACPMAFAFHDYQLNAWGFWVCWRCGLERRKGRA